MPPTDTLQQTQLDINRNSQSAIAERLSTGRLHRLGPFLILPVRFLLALLIQLAVSQLFYSNQPDAVEKAGQWFTVYGSLIDLGCLILIFAFLRPEGIRLRDLVNFQSGRLWKEIGEGVLLLLLFLVVGITGGAITGYLFFNGPGPNPMVPLPTWGALFSIIAFPVIWGFTEELTYAGYSFPRLQVITKNTWIAYVLVSFFWALQHIALPLRFDTNFMLYRFFSSLPIALVVLPIYMKKRRLLPFILAHWVVDRVSAVLGNL